MPIEVVYPGVYLEEIPSGVRTIAGVSTSTALFIGWARRGPTNYPVRIQRFGDFDVIFGGFDADSYLGYAVHHFFDNGGSDALVVRIVDPRACRASSAVGRFNLCASSAGAWGNRVRVDVTPTGQTTRWDVYEKQRVNGEEADLLVESFADISFDEESPRYIAAVLNSQSAVIAVEPSAPVAGSPDLVLPAPISLRLTGGDDGAVLGPGDEQFRTAAIAVLDDTTNLDDRHFFNLICVPGLTDRQTLEAIQIKAAERRAFLVADCSADAGVDTVIDQLPMSPAASHSALYFPWIVAPDPASQVSRNFPPSGFIAGLFARTDSARGVWKAPSGTDARLNGVSGLAVEISDREAGLLNPRAVNCLRTINTYGTLAWGARTLGGDDRNASDWKYVPVRRMALYIEESLYRGLQWVVFEPNGEPLWSQIRLNVGGFMQGLFRQGAFQGSSPRDAYFVKCDRDTNTAADIDRGIVNIVVGFAPLKPAEFVVITIRQLGCQSCT